MIIYTICKIGFCSELKINYIKYLFKTKFRIMIPIFINIAIMYPNTLNTFGPFKNPSNTLTTI